MAKRDAKRDAFIGDFKSDFKKLLESIPDRYSLEEWQFAYRHVVFSMGMKILKNFSHDVVGPDPSGAQGGGPKPSQSPSKSRGPGMDGQTGGGHQTVCKIVCAVLDVTPTT